jgi:hypothetical protein
MKFSIITFWHVEDKLNISGTLSFMFVQCSMRCKLVEIPNNVHWLYHSFILYTGSYMLRQ